jgi:hypothetical protein
MLKKQRTSKFVICVSNKGCDDLQIWKLYRVLPDADGKADGYLRVVDDSGEDYLYPAARFVPVEFSAAVQRQILSAAASVA